MLCGICGTRKIFYSLELCDIEISRFTRGFLSEDPLQVVICEDHIQNEREVHIP